jgi:hypothetical protein
MEQNTAIPTTSGGLLPRIDDLHPRRVIRSLLQRGRIHSHKNLPWSGSHSVQTRARTTELLERSGTPDSIPHVSINHLTGCPFCGDRCPEGWSALLGRIPGSRVHGARRPDWAHVSDDSDHLSRQCVESSFMRLARFRPFEVEEPRIRMLAASESDHFSLETEVRLLVLQPPTIRAVPRRLP